MPFRSKRYLRSLPMARERGTKRYFEYARVSSQDQADRDLSIPAQLKALHEYATRRGLLIVEQFIDIESAKEPGRTKFTEMMTRLQKDPRIAGVISHKVDRLLRNFKDYALVDDLMSAGVDFQFVTGNYDNSPVGKLGLGVQVLFAKHYLDNLSQEVKKGLNERMLEKRKWSFIAPIGYLNKDREIIPDPDRFTILREAWQRYATGAYAVPQIVDWLYAQGLRTRGSARRPAGRKLYRSPVYAMFNNPFYYGMMRFNGQLIPGTHEPMVSKTTFDRVQEILKNRGNPRPLEKEFTYRGFLVCGECGRAVTAEEQKGHIYYRCTKSKGGARSCGQKYLREESLEAQLTAQLKALEIPAAVYGLLRKPMQDAHAQEKEFRDKAIAVLRRRQDEIQSRQDVLLNLLIEGTVSKDVYNEKYTALQNEKAMILIELEAHKRANERHFEEMETLFSFVQRLADIFTTGDSDRKMTLLKVLASNATLESQKARLNLRPAFAVVAKMGPRSDWQGRRDSNPQQRIWSPPA